MNHQSHIPDEIRHVIIKFLRHESTPEEITALENWLLEDPSHPVSFDHFNRTYRALASDDGGTVSDIDGAWNVLAGRLMNDEKLTSPVVQLENPGRFIYLKIAASLLIVLLAGAATWKYFNSSIALTSSETRIAAGDEKEEILLPDGTRVWLNAHSELHYKNDFGKTTRNVTLAGEAFFDVTKTGIEFTVSTQSLVVQVKGTKFNVTVFADGRERATLEEGKVELQIKGQNKPIEMSPGDQVTFNDRSNELIREVVNAASYSVWKERELHFENATLGEIVEQLEIRFHVNVSIDPKIAERESLSMTIRDETLGEVLELIAISSTLHYKIDEKNVVIFE
jgi:transmembrane sensor